MPQFTASAPASPKFDAKARQRFLDQLAEKANVSASAKAAGVSPSSVYRERRRSESFRALWSAALAEGYARLETDLLSEALISVSGDVTAKTLQSRAQKYRLGLTLLSAHRVSVTGRVEPKAPAKGQSTARQRMEAKFSEMHARMAGPSPEPKP